MLQVLKIADALKGQWEAMKFLACSEAHALELKAQVSELIFIFGTLRLVPMAVIPSRRRPL